MQEYSFTPSDYQSEELTLGRVNVFLGANGCGKSKLLNQIKANSKRIFGNAKPQYVEGGRTITIHPSLAINRGNYQQYSTAQKAMQTHEGKLSNQLSTRVQDALHAVDADEKRINEEYRVELEKWIHEADDQLNPNDAPQKETLPMQNLCKLFNEVFPEITIILNASSKELGCEKFGTKYKVDSLSDGEKQTLSLLADLAILGKKDGVIIVDEPELNLNASLANKVWGVIENALPSAIFVYATHNVQFAMRATVDAVFIMKGEQCGIEAIDGVSELEPHVLTSFLGSIPSILTAKRAILVEGHDHSLDRKLFEFLCTDLGVAVVPMGGCEDVVAVSTRIGPWEHIATDFQLIGMIDRDVRSDEELQRLEQKGVLVQPFRELESLLLDPSVVMSVAQQRQQDQVTLDVAVYENWVIAEFEKQLTKIVVKRAGHRSKMNIWLGVKNEELKGKDTEEVRKLMLKKAEEKRNFFDEKFSNEEVEKSFGEELARCKEAVEKRDIHEILKLMPAKKFLSALLPHLGFKNDEQYLETVIAKLTHRNFHT